MGTRIWRIDKEEILRRIKEWARGLRKDPSVLAVILFGSFARGEATPMSDADILIILSQTTLSFEERILKYRPVGLGVSVEVFPYTLEEAKKGLQEGWGVIIPAMREGIPLFKRRSFKLSSLLEPQ